MQNVKSTNKFTNRFWTDYKMFTYQEKFAITNRERYTVEGQIWWNWRFATQRLEKPEDLER